MEMAEIFVMLKPFIIPIIIGTCYILGELIKPLAFIDSKYIPIIMAIVGVLMNTWLNNFSFTPIIFFSGLASGWASTGAYESVKNILNKE